MSARGVWVRCCLAWRLEVASHAVHAPSAESQAWACTSGRVCRIYPCAVRRCDAVCTLGCLPSLVAVLLTPYLATPCARPDVLGRLTNGPIAVYNTILLCRARCGFRVPQEVRQQVLGPDR